MRLKDYKKGTYLPNNENPWAIGWPKMQAPSSNPNIDTVVQRAAKATARVIVLGDVLAPIMNTVVRSYEKYKQLMPSLSDLDFAKEYEPLVKKEYAALWETRKFKVWVPGTYSGSGQGTSGTPGYWSDVQYDTSSEFPSRADLVTAAFGFNNTLIASVFLPITIEMFNDWKNGNTEKWTTLHRSIPATPFDIMTSKIITAK